MSDHQAKKNKICGEYYYHFNPVKGIFVRYQYHCHKRDCPLCFGTRRDDWRAKVYDLARQNSDRLYLTVFDDATEAQRFKWRIDKRDTLYVRFKATRIYYFHTDDIEGGVKLLLEDLDSMDWDKLALTDSGCRASTNTNRKKSTKKDVAIIYVPNVKMDISCAEVNELWQRARTNCGSPTPETVEELQPAINQIATEFVKLVLADERILSLELMYSRVRILHSAKPRWSEPQYGWILPKTPVRMVSLQ